MVNKGYLNNFHLKTSKESRVSFLHWMFYCWIWYMFSSDSQAHNVGEMWVTIYCFAIHWIRNLGLQKIVQTCLELIRAWIMLMGYYLKCAQTATILFTSNRKCFLLSIVMTKATILQLLYLTKKINASIV